jgi:hypothetical protein
VDQPSFRVGHGYRILTGIRRDTLLRFPGWGQGQATAAGVPVGASLAWCDVLLRVDILFQALDEMAIGTHLKSSRILF